MVNVSSGRKNHNYRSVCILYRGVEIVKFSTSPGTSKKPKLYLSIENFTCPNEQISLYLTVLKQFIL